MVYDPIYKPLTYSEVKEYHNMVMKGRYDSGLPFVARTEAFLEAWLKYSPLVYEQIALQGDMELFADVFCNDFPYKGTLYRGIYSGREMPEGRLASWSPDYYTAVSFAVTGDGTADLIALEFMSDKDALIAIKPRGKEETNFYLSLFLETICYKTDNLKFRDIILHYLDQEDEVIALAYNIKYIRLSDERELYCKNTITDVYYLEQE